MGFLYILGIGFGVFSIWFVLSFFRLLTSKGWNSVDHIFGQFVLGCWLILFGTICYEGMWLTGNISLKTDDQILREIKQGTPNDPLTVEQFEVLKRYLKAHPQKLSNGEPLEPKEEPKKESEVWKWLQTPIGSKTE